MSIFINISNIHFHFINDINCNYFFINCWKITIFQYIDNIENNENPNENENKNKKDELKNKQNKNNDKKNIVSTNLKYYRQNKASSQTNNKKKLKLVKLKTNSFLNDGNKGRIRRKDI